MKRGNVCYADFPDLGFSLLLTQHLFAATACLLPLGSSRCKNGHPASLDDMKYKLRFRCSVLGLSKRGTKSPLAAPRRIAVSEDFL